MHSEPKQGLPAGTHSPTAWLSHSVIPQAGVEARRSPWTACSLLPLSVTQPAAGGANQGCFTSGLSRCGCRKARSKAAWPKATAGCSSPRCAARMFASVFLVEPLNFHGSRNSRAGTFQGKSPKIPESVENLLIIFLLMILPSLWNGHYEMKVTDRQKPAVLKIDAHDLDGLFQIANLTG